MRLFTRTEWARLGWHSRDRLRLTRIALVTQLEREHVARYGRSYTEGMGRAGARGDIRTGLQNGAA